MRSYPIWNNIQACIYEGVKSYGVKNEGVVNVLIGTSKSNSHDFLTHTTTVKRHNKNLQEFRFYVDNKLIKRSFVKNGKLYKRLNGFNANFKYLNKEVQ